MKNVRTIRCVLCDNGCRRRRRWSKRCIFSIAGRVRAPTINIDFCSACAHHSHVDLLVTSCRLQLDPIHLIHSFTLCVCCILNYYVCACRSLFSLEHGAVCCDATVAPRTTHRSLSWRHTASFSEFLINDVAQSLENGGPHARVACGPCIEHDPARTNTQLTVYYAHDRRPLTWGSIFGVWRASRVSCLSCNAPYTHITTYSVYTTYTTLNVNAVWDTIYYSSCSARRTRTHALARPMLRLCAPCSAKHIHYTRMCGTRPAHIGGQHHRMAGGWGGMMHAIRGTSLPSQSSLLYPTLCMRACRPLAITSLTMTPQPVVPSIHEYARARV